MGAFLGRVSKLFDIPDLMKTAREELLGLLALYGDVAGPNGFLGIAVKPETPGFSATQQTPWERVVDRALCEYPEEAPQAEIDNVFYGDVTGDGLQDALVGTRCLSPTTDGPGVLQLFDGARVGTPDLRPTAILLRDDPDGPRNATVRFEGTTLIVDADGNSPGSPRGR